PGPAARTHRPPTPPAPAHTSAARHWPALPSPCSARSPSPGRPARSACPPPAAAGGSQPSPPPSAPAPSPARLEPGSLGRWAKFGCRALVSIQLPPTHALGHRAYRAPFAGHLDSSNALGQYAAIQRSAGTLGAEGVATLRPASTPRGAEVGGSEKRKPGCLEP